MILPLENRIYCGFKNGTPIYYGGPGQDRHCMMLGPTGSGKDTSSILPNALTLNETLFIFDPAAEVLATAGRFREKLGWVEVVNPMGTIVNELDQRGNRKYPHLANFKSRGYNPLHSLSVRKPSFSSDVPKISEAIFTIDPKDRHWGRRCRQLGNCLIMRECWFADEEKRNPSMENVMDMLSLPHVVDEKESEPSLSKLLTKISTHHYRPMARLAPSFIRETPEVNSVLASAAEACQSLMMDDQLIADMNLGGAIDWERGKHEVGTVFIVLPGDMFETHAVWLRLLLADAINAMTKTGPGKQRPIFILNEVGNLGRLDALKRAVGMIRKNGARLNLFLQDLNQLEEIYGAAAAGSFIANMGMISSFATNDPATWDYFCKRAGTVTVEMDSYRTDQSGDQKQRHAAGFNVLNPEDVASIDARKTGNFLHGVPYYVELDTPFYEDICRGYDPNPYH